MTTKAAFSSELHKLTKVQGRDRRKNNDKVISTTTKMKPSEPRLTSSKHRVRSRNEQRAESARKNKPFTNPQQTYTKPAYVQQISAGQTWQVAQRNTDSDDRGSKQRNIITADKVLIVLAIAISAVFMFVFGMDLLTGWPFQGHSLLMDTSYLVFGILLLYLTWDTYRNMR